jgi:hypothetical protein
MKMHLTTTDFERYCDTLCQLIPDMTMEQARECLSNVFYRCDYATALNTRIQSVTSVKSSSIVQAFSDSLNGKPLLLSTKSSAILFRDGAIHVPRAVTEERVIKEFAKRLKNRIDSLKHSHALTILSKIMMGVDYSPTNFSAGRSHPANVFVEQCRAEGVAVTPFFVPSFSGNVWAAAEIEQLVISAEKMGANKEGNIFATLVDASSVTIDGKPGYPAFSAKEFRAGDVIKSDENGPAGALSECLFVWSPEHADGTVYDIEFSALCDAHHLGGNAYRVQSATGRVTIEIHR